MTFLLIGMLKGQHQGVQKNILKDNGGHKYIWAENPLKGQVARDQIPWPWNPFYPDFQVPACRQGRESKEGDNMLVCKGLECVFALFNGNLFLIIAKSKDTLYWPGVMLCAAVGMMSVSCSSVDMFWGLLRDRLWELFAAWINIPSRQHP